MQPVYRLAFNIERPLKKMQRHRSIDQKVRFWRDPCHKMTPWQRRSHCLLSN
ncbi:hypothetical protein [Phaeobacter sp. 11ANDIMAR09]|uniref:hypothetical protein n=1 Tax=Phaeobacter sp. 11ANDIMAR09 TaxID=1225647 RepID=UPI0035294765